jgi:thermitase
MLIWLYPTSYFISLLGLIMWFYFKDDKKMSKLMSTTFLGGFFVYLFALAFSSGALSTKVFVLARDLVVLGLVSQFFNFFKENKLIFFIMLVVLFGSYQFKYKSYLMQSFVEDSEVVDESEVAVDKEWELLVEIKNGHDITELESIINKFGLNYEPAFVMANSDITDLDNYYAVNIPSEREHILPEIESELDKSELTVWVEQNEIVNIDPIPATKLPPPTNIKYGINDPLLDQLWGFEVMEMDKLYQLLKDEKITPQRKASIMILDTGIDAKHEDIKKNYKTVNVTHDTDFNGHGTHCAGIAAAVSNNGVGIASFSTDNQFVEVSAVKVLGPGGNGSQRGVVNGILSAADNHADVISLSLGSRSNSQKRKTFKIAIDYTKKAGSIVVVAAGNSNMNAKNYAPANTPGVITVSAIDTSMNRASFSNFVNDVEMGIAAPGVKIYSTIPRNKYAAFNGTSMAAPHVSGLVGLMKSIQPSLPTKEAYEMIHLTGKDTKDVEETGRLINPSLAIMELLKQKNTIK